MKYTWALFFLVKGEIIMYQTRIFFGTNGLPADVDFNKWIKDHPNIEILQFKFQQARYGDHSIAILYKENEE